MNEIRSITYAEAVLEATDQAMQMDPSVIVIGQGTRDPGAIFGTAAGLYEKYGPKRIIEMPLSENAITGICIGAALNNLRPLYILQRVDFLLLALDQLVNHAAKWHFMFGGKAKVPLVIRCIIGKGWGQGPQHSQSLHGTLAHFPGLRIGIPAQGIDAKGLILNGLFSDDPVVLFEGRPLHGRKGPVPAEPYVTPFGQARLCREGRDLTIVATSYLVPEAEEAAKELASHGVSAEVIDLVSVSPFDEEMIAGSVEKTGRLLVADISWGPCGISSEIAARISRRLFGRLKAPVETLPLPFCPVPTARSLEEQYYPTAQQIVDRSLALSGISRERTSATIGSGPRR